MCLYCLAQWIISSCICILKLPDKKQEVFYYFWVIHIIGGKELYAPLVSSSLPNSLISEANWIVRGRCRSGEDLGIRLKPGDICYLDYGQAYLNEAGYQHFGLVITVYSHKALVVPMTSNKAQYASAYDEKENPRGKRHLMRIGALPGMAKPSVLFLNDMKFIKAHMDENSVLFLRVKTRLLRIISGMV